MGATMSAEENSVVTVFKKILEKRGIKYDETQLRMLLAWLKGRGVAPELTEVFETCTWETAGQVLWYAATRGDSSATGLLTTRRLVTDSLKQLKADRTVTAAAAAATLRERQKEAAAATANELAPTAPPSPDFPPPPSPMNMDSSFAEDPYKEKNRGDFECVETDYDPRKHWQELRQQAEKSGDHAIAALIACPVIRDAQGRTEWQGLPFGLVKELRKNVMDYGLGSPYVQSLLNTVFFNYELTPYDIKQISMLIFTPTQKVMFDAHWRTACEMAAITNSERPDGDPLRGAGIPQLMGEAPVQTPQLQARLNPAILQQSRQLAYQALLKTPDTGKATQSFVSIKQGIAESFMSFIDKLKEAIEKQVENEAAREVLLMKLAVENASVDCKRVLQTLRNPNMVEMMEACQKVGSFEHQAQAMASAFAALRFDNRACFRCGKTGHFKRNCPNINQIPNSGPGVCPRCGKGRHYANQCRSKWDKDGKPIQGNFRTSASRRHTSASASHDNSNGLQGRTAGSTGMDVATDAEIIIEDQTVHRVPLNARGPLGGGLSALLLGRSSVTLKGLFVLPGVVDADYEGQIQAMIWTPSPPVVIPKGSRIAQLVPFRSQVPVTDSVKRGKGGFGSTGTPLILWAQTVQSQRPMLTCTLSNGQGTPRTIKLQGMIDTGADVTVISKAKWPQGWPIKEVASALSGIGGTTTSYQSVYMIQVIGPEGQVSTTRPFVVAMPLILWGRDVLCSWGVTIGTQNF
ncbi:LOW QUALITY PROTEIN: hypothetical protein QYF61_007368 [Mycteria americana]|uniref:Uncharacterized protein n=1 Tax=Mycteria americana TaxID=33587 RepID=A0AAN7RVS7_MYCAM|nr:LOW QUALITY PROTEIN: hypothetical protein QYF61_007368 [Mycteria americana]